MADDQYQEDNLSNYAVAVHRSLLRQKFLAGISIWAALLIILQTGVIVGMLKQYLFLIAIIVEYFILKYLTKKDPYFIETLWIHLFEKRIYIP